MLRRIDSYTQESYNTYKICNNMYNIDVTNDDQVLDTYQYDSGLAWTSWLFGQAAETPGASLNSPDSPTCLDNLSDIMIIMAIR